MVREEECPVPGRCGAGTPGEEGHGYPGMKERQEKQTTLSLSDDMRPHSKQTWRPALVYLARGQKAFIPSMYFPLTCFGLSHTLFLFLFFF